MALKVLMSSVPVESSSDVGQFAQKVSGISEFSGTIQNLWWIIVVVITTLCYIGTFFLFSTRTSQYTRKQISKLIENGKYIPGLFIELNETKEVLRYFVHKRAWKKRLIRDFNIVYSNEYGKILKSARIQWPGTFHLKKFSSFHRIQANINFALELHKKIERRKVQFKSGYEESQPLFEILHYPYSETLNLLYKCCRAATQRYIILTGSAGNGKTNLLCSICELLLCYHEPVIFLNSRDISGNICEFLFSELEIPEFFLKHQKLFWNVINCLFWIRRKYLYIVIDAINENDRKDFEKDIAKLCTKLLKYKRINILVSCRNEYYKQRFRKPLVEQVDATPFELDLKEQLYTPHAIERTFKVYRDFFNYTGEVSLSVKEILTQQLLLLRMFFEVFKDSSENVSSIRKHEVFAKYISSVQNFTDTDVTTILNALADFMITNAQYDYVEIENLLNSNIDVSGLQKILDGSVLISKRIVSHEGTIASNEQEVIYFVFDDLRDYYLARRLLLGHISKNTVNGESILERIIELKECKSSCAEGVIHYAYCFFRTDEIVIQSGLSEELCKKILNIYHIPDRSEKSHYWYRNNEREFQNLGLRIIMTSELPIENFEVEFIRECLRKAPYEDAAVLFETMVRGALTGSQKNLDFYLYILFGLKSLEELRKVFVESISNYNFEDSLLLSEFITYHKTLYEKNVDAALQIQKTAELFLLCFRCKDILLQRSLETYFYSLPLHNIVQQELQRKLNKLRKDGEESCG